MVAVFTLRPPLSRTRTNRTDSVRRNLALIASRPDGPSGQQNRWTGGPGETTVAAELIFIRQAGPGRPGGPAVLSEWGLPHRP